VTRRRTRIGAYRNRNRRHHHEAWQTGNLPTRHRRRPSLTGHHALLLHRIHHQGRTQPGNRHGPRHPGQSRQRVGRRRPQWQRGTDLRAAARAGPVSYPRAHGRGVLQINPLRLASPSSQPRLPSDLSRSRSCSARGAGDSRRSCASLFIPTRSARSTEPSSKRSYVLWSLDE